MVCATNDSLMIAEQHKQPYDFMEDEDSEEDSSQDGTQKAPIAQALFLNFTSDLSPQKMSRKKPKPKKQTAYRVNGVNILNRNNLDSKTAIERIQRRRENHNHVERRRRDNINNTIFELSSVVPNAIQPGQKPNKGNILKLSLDYIKDLQAENMALKERLCQYTSQNPSLSSPTASSPFLSPNDDTDESLLKNQTQPSPSAPNSPKFLRNTNHQFQLAPQSMSVPSSPHHHYQHTNLPYMANLTPLSLPPSKQQQQQQQQQQQHLQTVFSTMSVSSNSSSNVSTPTSSSSSPYPYYNSQPQFQQHPIQPQTSLPQIQTTHGYRTLLPATTPSSTQFIPSIRMSGYEKIYGNVCRY
ncbi:hypothetical protein BD560DRAFT_400701 [Blakeslea trispora]|nr:hypothetical protein BD560DRAFT_400701 [Blakeslea trispora]